jgi:hypothetical protein
MVDVAGVEAQHVCDVISVVAEFMVDVAGVEAQHACDPIAIASNLGCVPFLIWRGPLHIL